MFDKLKKKIHIIQNIYLKNKYLFKKSTYAMDGEDTAIDKFVENKSNGFYVDLGAHHPLHRNNTYLLFKKGWEGINIDLDKKNIELFKIDRKRDSNINEAVYSSKVKKKLYYLVQSFCYQ